MAGVSVYWDARVPLKSGCGVSYLDDLSIANDDYPIGVEINRLFRVRLEGTGTEREGLAPNCKCAAPCHLIPITTF